MVSLIQYTVKTRVSLALIDVDSGTIYENLTLLNQKDTAPISWCSQAQSECMEKLYVNMIEVFGH